MARRTAKGNYEHPAKFSAPILTRIVRTLETIGSMDASKQPLLVVDPFGGVGGIHRIVVAGIRTLAIEIEPEWAEESAKLGPTICTDFFKWAREVEANSVDVFCTSPTYGNRMADHHVPSPEDTSRRNTYRHVLERPLTPGNSGELQWGNDYQDFHRRALRAMFGILKPGGYLILNVSDHIRKRQKMPVVAWYKTTARAIGFELVSDELIPTKRNRQGENHEARVDGEHLLVFRKAK
jgi:hypothetical protein